jgi:hypothetical protein
MTKSSHEPHPYHVVYDEHGGKASVFFSPNGIHTIVYTDNKNHKFYTEEFKGYPIQTVEQTANDWSLGLHKIA